MTIHNWCSRKTLLFLTTCLPFDLTKYFLDFQVSNKIRNLKISREIIVFISKFNCDFIMVVTWLWDVTQKHDFHFCTRKKNLHLLLPVQKAVQKTCFSFFYETFINDVLRFSVIFDLPTYPTLSYNVQFLGLFWTPLPTLKSDVIYGRSLMKPDTSYQV